MIAIHLHLPLTIVLIGIVARGSAFVFRSYGSPTEMERRRWGLVFAMARGITRVFLGICVGAVASGQVGQSSHLGAVGSAFDLYITGWLFSVTALAVGVFTLTLFAFLAAVYLAYGSSGDLQEDFRRRALAAAGAVFVMAAVALAASYVDAERIATGITITPIGLVIQV